jgi:hypothetical protein
MKRVGGETVRLEAPAQGVDQARRQEQQRF